MNREEFESYASSGDLVSVLLNKKGKIFLVYGVYDPYKERGDYWAPIYSRFHYEEGSSWVAEVDVGGPYKQVIEVSRSRNIRFRKTIFELES